MRYRIIWLARLSEYICIWYKISINRGGSIMKLNLRSFLSLGLVIMLIFSLAACGKAETPAQATPAPTQAPAAATPEPAAKPFEGQIIRYVAANHMWNDTIKPLIPEFENETGMTVSLESYEASQLTQ
jgi:multiple sugar transport system substrate-binding protein